MRQVGEGSSVRFSKTLKIARAIYGRPQPTTEELRVARKMAHEGYTTIEIRDALGWKITMPAMCRRMKKFNIRPRNPSNAARRGYPTKIPEGDQVSMNSYRPKPMEHH